MQNENVPKVSFFSAAVTLSELCDRVDSEEELNEAFLAEFENATQSLEESIDRRKYVYQEAEFYIKAARDRKKSLDATIKKLVLIQDRIERRTKEMIEAEPNLPYRDSLGNKLSVRKNSQAALNINLDFRESRSISNILDDTITNLLEISPKYIKTVTFSILNTEQVKADLVAGAELPWASLQWGTHLRGLS